MQTLQRAPGWRILRNEAEMTDGLQMAGIDRRSIGLDPSYSFEKLVSSCDENHMFLMQRGRHVKLVVYVAVVVLQHHRGREFLELKEDRQVFHGTRREVRRGFRGIAETIERNGTPALTDGHITSEAHRVLKDELGPTMPLFKQGRGYSFTRRCTEILWQQHDKWPLLQAEFVRFVHLAYMENGLLYRPEYIEVAATKTIYFSWHRANLKDNVRLPVTVPLP